MTESLSRYRPTIIATIIVAIVGLWPVLLAPLGRIYIELCARYLTDVPFGHHAPPLLVAFVAPIVLVLVIGFVIALLRQVTGQRHLERVLSARRCALDAHTQQIVSTLGAEGRIVATSDTAVYAFCSGLMRPRVYLSQGLLDLLTEEEIEAVMRHELHHVNQRDPLRFFASRISRRLAVVFPVLAILDDRVRINAELTADRAALAVMPLEALAGALINVMRTSPTSITRLLQDSRQPTHG
jgi:Zn-dependent protease with chaperone function